MASEKMNTEITTDLVTKEENLELIVNLIPIKKVVNVMANLNTVKTVNTAITMNIVKEENINLITREISIMKRNKKKSLLKRRKKLLNKELKLKFPLNQLNVLVSLIAKRTLLLNTLLLLTNQFTVLIPMLRLSKNKSVTNRKN